MIIIKALIPNKERIQKLKATAQQKGAFCRQQASHLMPLIKKYQKPIMILVGILVILMIVTWTLPKKTSGDNDIATDIKPSSLSSTSVSKTQAGDYLTQRLQDISDQLATIRSRLDGDGSANFTSLSQQLTSLIDQTKALSSESNKMITDQIQESSTALKQQLTLMTAALVKLQKQQQHVKYLKPRDLPFTLASIDNIQQSNIVTINYDHMIFPIEIDSYVAGWKLINADFVGQTAEFVNAKKQHVIVDLNRMQENSERSERREHKGGSL